MALLQVSAGNRIGNDNVLLIAEAVVHSFFVLQFTDTPFYHSQIKELAVSRTQRLCHMRQGQIRLLCDISQFHIWIQLNDGFFRRFGCAHENPPFGEEAATHTLPLAKAAMDCHSRRVEHPQLDDCGTTSILYCFCKYSHSLSFLHTLSFPPASAFTPFKQTPH